ncbi:MAG: aromatic alcohol reductase [Verrucomicrobia bacterium]|nr:aromatic alcohol reductase [Verrucomicrobiota bacterium]
METNKILVLGAGELGMSVLRGLAAHSKRGHSKLTVLLRPSALESASPDKRRDLVELRSLGISFQPGDLVSNSEADLKNLFKDFDTVIGCTGFVAGPNIQLKLARAVLAAGIDRYFPWQFGVDYDVIGRGSGQDLFDEQLEVRNFLRSQSRVKWVIISTGMFTSFLFEPAFGVVDLERNTVRALGSWDTTVTVTTSEDIGSLTADIVFFEPRIANEIVYTAGDTISYRRLADVIDSILERKVRREEWTLPALEAALAQAPDDSLRKYRVAFAKGRGVSWNRGKTFNARHNIEIADVARWLREHKK